ncbi:MAG TPA: hypothetical protein VIK00_06565, partial [Candidatus Limnocylindrales bacterium]
DRPAAETLADAEAVYDDFVAAVRALPIDALTDSRRFTWLEGESLAEVDFGSHLALHEMDVREWLARG